MLLTVSVSPKLKELGKALILHHIWNVNDCMNFLVPEFLLTPRALPDSGIAPMSLFSITHTVAFNLHNGSSFH